MPCGPDGFRTCDLEEPRTCHIYTRKALTSTRECLFNIRLFDLMLDLIDIYTEVLHIDYEKLGSNVVGDSSVSIQERE
jgi:hypothetical protein